MGTSFLLPVLYIEVPGWIEPQTLRFSVACSTTELPRHLENNKDIN